MLKSILPLAIFAFSALASNAQEIVTLTNSNPTVTFSSTDVVTVIGSTESRKLSVVGSLYYTLSGKSEEGHFPVGGSVGGTPFQLMGCVFSGLSSMRVGAGTNGADPVSDTFCVTLQVVKQGQQLLSNPMVTPGAADAKYDVSLETSTDMVTWVPTVPGEFLGATGQRFFRVRAVVK